MYDAFEMAACLFTSDLWSTSDGQRSDDDPLPYGSRAGCRHPFERLEYAVRSGRHPTARRGPGGRHQAGRPST